MTEELVELTDKIKVAVAKNVDLEQKREELTRELKEVELNNYTNILFEELNIYMRLANDLRTKFKDVVKYRDSEREKDSYYGLYLSFKYDNEEAFFKVNSNGFTEYLSLRTDCNGLSQFNSFSRNQVEGFADYLGSEEKTLKTLERVRKGFASIFNQYLEQINKENEELYNAVEGLSKKLADSSVMKEEEDGTVEIHLNGKTFRGKVVEE